MEMSLPPQRLDTRDLPDLDGHREALEALIDEERDDLVRLIQRIQERFGFVPGNVLEVAAQRAEVPLAHLLGLATFYTSFYLRPRVRNVVRVCHGTACHVQGASRITEALELRLGIRSGETTDDLGFTLEEVACLGCCSLAPVRAGGEQTHGRLDRPATLALVDARARADDDSPGDAA